MDEKNDTETLAEVVTSLAGEMSAGAYLTLHSYAARIVQARAETWTCPDCEGEFPAEQARAGEGALRERVEALHREVPFLDFDIERLRAALAETDQP